MGRYPVNVAAANADDARQALQMAQTVYDMVTGYWQLSMVSPY